MIFHSFKKTGIYVKLDNSERGLINISDKLIEENEIPDPDNILIQNINVNENISIRNTISQKSRNYSKKFI